MDNVQNGWSTSSTIPRPIGRFTFITGKTMPKLKMSTLGDLRQQMQWTEALPPETPVYFGNGDLTLLRVKDRGGDRHIAQFEFSEEYEVTLDPNDNQALQE